MTTESVLARLSEPKLRAWILARMRGEQEDPPIDEGRLESPDDYVRAMHHQARDAKFRARIEKAALAALREVAAGDLRGGPDARAARHLAALMDGLELRAAAPLLEEIAERGAFGGRKDGLDPDAEGMVLFALAGLQAPGALWSKWYALWQRKIPRLWPVVTAGLRLSDPEKALAILPDVVDRAGRYAKLPLGEVLWAFATDERYEGKNIAEALKGLSPTARERCREALSALGAEQDELDEWLPEPNPAPKSGPPAWARRSSITRPPRFTEALAWAS